MNRDSTVEKMVSYMNEKYDDHFEYLSPFGGGPGATSKQIFVSSEQYPEAQIWVQYYKLDNKEIFTDNYVSYKYEEQTRGLLEKLLTDAFHNNIVLFYKVGIKGTVNQFAEQTTFEEYISDVKAKIGFQACVLLETSEIDTSLLKQAWEDAIKSSGLIAFGTIYFTDNVETFNEVSRLSVKEFDLFNFDSFIRLRVGLDELSLFEYSEWSAGNDR